jgi:hypothetical protein
MALTAHDALKTGIPQSSLQIEALEIDSEGPKRLEGCRSAIKSEQSNFLGAEKVGSDFAQAVDRILLTPTLGQPLARGSQAQIVDLAG